MISVLGQRPSVICATLRLISSRLTGNSPKKVAADPDNQVMIQSLRSISDHFGMFTIAEAVGCERDSQWLSEMLADCQQGYFWGAPTVNPNWHQGYSEEEAATA